VREVAGGVAVELQGYVAIDVGEVGIGGGSRTGAVGIDAPLDPLVEDVVRLIDGLGDRAAGVLERDIRQPVAVVPSVFFLDAGGDRGLGEPVPFVVVGVVVRAVGGEPGCCRWSSSRCSSGCR